VSNTFGNRPVACRWFFEGKIVPPQFTTPLPGVSMRNRKVA
jgi:hypothetical protein